MTPLAVELRYATSTFRFDLYKLAGQSARNSDVAKRERCSVRKVNMTISLASKRLVSVSGKWIFAGRVRRALRNCPGSLVIRIVGKPDPSESCLGGRARAEPRVYRLAD